MLSRLIDAAGYLVALALGLIVMCAIGGAIAGVILLVRAATG